MLDYDEIRCEIRRLENADTTYANVEKLAMLYQVVNNAHECAENAEKTPVQPVYRYAQASDSEFLQAAENAPLDGLMRVLDEHMEAVRVLYPKEYRAVIRKISEL